MNNRRTVGFTLVETLVAMAIIASLTALAIPSIHAARESARRSVCLQRIGQLALAAENHQSAHGVYPPGRFQGKFGAGPESTAWSWMAMSLPFIEEQGIYDQGNIPIATLEDSAIAHEHIASFICPSAGEHSQPTFAAGNLVGFPVGQTNYKGVSGANWGADRSLARWTVRTRFRVEGTHGSFDGLGDGDGLMWRSDIERRMNHRRVADGTSKTFLIGEDLPRHNIWASWPYSNNAYGTCAIPPNYVPDDKAWQYESYSFRSDHRNGTHFAFADGSARFISNGIEMAVYRGLATRDGREPNASL